MKIFRLAIYCLLLTQNLSAQINLDFENGIEGWNANVRVIKDSLHHRSGKYCIELINAGKISRQVKVSGLAIVQFKVFAMTPDTGAGINSFVSFYNSAGKLLLHLDNSFKPDTSFLSTGNYCESPPASSFMEIGFEKDSTDSKVYLDDFSVQVSHGIDEIKPQPLVDLDAYLKPFWKSDTIINETVLMYSVSGKPATGKLMFHPEKILSVRSFDLRNLYKINKDYKTNGAFIIATDNSSVPVVADTFFKKENLIWYDLSSQWLVVSYVHKEKWKEPSPRYQGYHTPLTISKLVAKKPVTIAAYGMSITRGMDVSGFDSVPPFMPSYADLFIHSLKKHYHNDNIRFYNAALPGADAAWGAKFVDHYISPLKADLVILDFGMNDFWRYSPQQFSEYIDTMMKKIRLSNNKVEFLLISNMKFDPEYIKDSDPNKLMYLKNFNGYNKVLKQIQQKGVIFFDMTTLSGTIYNAKKPRDCIANPLHPNDYLARWYAQGMSALMIR